MLTFFSGIWGKIAAGAAALLAILGAVLWIFQKGKGEGRRAEQETQRKNLESAKDDKRKIQTGSAGLGDDELRDRLREQQRHLP